MSAEEESEANETDRRASLGKFEIIFLGGNAILAFYLFFKDLIAFFMLIAAAVLVLGLLLIIGELVMSNEEEDVEEAVLREWREQTDYIYKE